MSTSLRRRLAGRRIFLELGIVSEVLGSLLRTFVLARLLPPEQFGIATALILVMLIVDIGSDIGLERSILRIGFDMDEALERDTLQLLNLVRGLVLGAILFLTGPFLAQLFSAPEAAREFALLGIAPMIQGLFNLSVRELAREHIYGAEGLTLVALHISTMVASIIFAVLTGSHAAVLYGIVVGKIVQVLASHLLAPFRWRLRWSEKAALKAWHFGAPLIPNGLAMVLRNFDRVIVGALTGPAPLGVYSIAVMIGIMPRGILLRYATTMFLSRFINAGEGPHSARLTDAFSMAMAAVSAFFGVGLWAVGQPLIAFVFGEKYLPDQALITAVALMVVVKLQYSAITMPALAFGKTKLMLAAMPANLTGLGLGAAVLAWTKDLGLFVFAITAAELIGLVITVRKGSKQMAMTQSVAYWSALGPAMLLIVLGSLSETPIGAYWPLRLVEGVLACVLSLTVILIGAARMGLPPRELLRVLTEKIPRTGMGPA